MGDAEDSGIGLATARTPRAAAANLVLAGHGAQRPDGGNRVCPSPA